MNLWSVEAQTPGESPSADAEWDLFAEVDSRTGIMQSSAWSLFKQAEGYSSKRFVARRNGAIMGGGAFYCSPLGGFASCPQGPSIGCSDLETERTILRFIVAHAQPWSDGLSALGLRIEPMWEGNRPNLLRNWSRSPIDLTPIHTRIIDVSKDNESLLSDMSPKGRYNIGLALRKGISVRQSIRMEDVMKFHSLFIQTAARNQIFAEPLSFFCNLIQHLCAANRAIVLLAELDGEALAGAILTRFGRRTTYLYGASGELLRELMPAYAVQWSAMQWARSQGCTEYDMFGEDPFGHPNHLYAGITRFKRQFGGTSRTTIGAWDLINYDRLASSLVDQLGSIQYLEEAHS